MKKDPRLIEILEQLLRFRTVTGQPAAAAVCLDYAEQMLDDLDMHIKRHKNNGFESLVATTRATKTPTVMLQAHLDVVPADEALFELRREGGKLMGRGTFDMKYAAACYLRLAETLGPKLADFDFGIMLTTDEECDGSNGVKYLLDEGYGCTVCILPDGGDNWRVETAAKGAWNVDAKAHGKSAHGSRPWDGDNAATRLVHFLHEAEALAPVASHTDTTLVVSTIQAGNARNQVPDEATATLDIRYLQQQNYEDIKQRLHAVAAAHGVTLTTRFLIDAIELDVSLPVIQSWEQVVSEVRGAQAKDGYALSFGASDARYFAVKGIPAIVTRPDGGGMHGDSEWIDEAGLYEFYECLRRYTEVIARQPLTTSPKQDVAQSGTKHSASPSQPAAVSNAI